MVCGRIFIFTYQPLYPVHVLAIELEENKDFSESQ